MSGNSLEDVLRATGDVVALLRNSPIGAYVYPVVPPEFTNWRDEQRAWRETAVLFDQSHHMAELMVEGPDAARLLAGPRRQQLRQLPRGPRQALRAVQPRRPRHRRRHPVPPGRAPVLTSSGGCRRSTGCSSTAETGGWEVTPRRATTARRRGRWASAVVRRHYRYQIQGPNAPEILEKLHGGPVPEIRFFHIGAITIAGRQVRALRHGMAGAPGLEVWGPYAEGEEVRAAILEAGRDFGLRQVGSRAYATNTLDSGWIPSPLPAVYTGEAMRAYREWLPADGYEATGSIGGSFVSRQHRGLLPDAVRARLRAFVKFDHDFIGRAALERLAGHAAAAKVTFAWDADDVARVHPLDASSPAIETVQVPSTCRSRTTPRRPTTRVQRTAGRSGSRCSAATATTSGRMLSLGVVDPDVQVGDLLTLVWGEENGGTRKTTVEPHTQTEIRVKVGAGALLAHGPRELRRRMAHGRLSGRWRGRRDRPTIAESKGGVRADRQGRVAMTSISTADAASVTVRGRDLAPT